MNFHIHKRKDRDGWWYLFRYKGKRYRGKGGRTKAMSLAIAEYRLADLIKAKNKESNKSPPKSAEPEPIKAIDYLNDQIEWLRLYKKPITARRYINTVNQMIEFFTNIRHVSKLKDLSVRHLEEYLRWRSAVIALSSVDDERIRVGMILKNAVKYGYIDENPAKKIEKIKTPEKPPDFYTPVELAAIFDNADYRLRNVYIVFAFTGMRKEELSNLEWSDIDMDNREIRVQVKKHWQPKNGHSRTIPMSDQVYEIISNRKEHGESDRWVFSRSDGSKYPVNYLWRKLQTILKRLSIQGNVHKFRHTFASMLVQQGVDLYRVIALMGHRDVSTTQRYANLRKSALHDAIQCLTKLKGPIQICNPIQSPLLTTRIFIPSKHNMHAAKCNK
ncbi:MAG: site-specific integrase [Calditrichaeota bacterium]|nr:site-specific integrase [Calditrichota bacterium]